MIEIAILLITTIAVFIMPILACISMCRYFLTSNRNSFRYIPPINPYTPTPPPKIANPLAVLEYYYFPETNLKRTS